jgi:phosphopantothenoylcysteine decarboxylase / phosphopantothenate---cysteine ligase
VTVVPPDTGELASRGEWGAGRLAEPAAILAAIEKLAGGDGFVPRSLDGLRVLITAGGTREPIDSVRFVGNRSSGRMGFALADECARRGASVTVVAANVSLPRGEGIEYVDVETAAQLDDACRAAFADADVLLMAAAVADFRPAGSIDDKIKKEGRDGMSLELEPTTDVLAALSAERRPGQVLVGFAAEHGDVAVPNARGKLERKGLDAVVVNDISQKGIGFDTPENEVTIVLPGEERPVPKASKAEVAAAIVDVIEDLRAGSHTDGGRELAPPHGEKGAGS